MTVSISPQTATVLRGRSFEVTISAVTDGSVISVEGEAVQPEPTVEVINNDTSVTIKGQYFDAWADKFTYVSAGESDLTEIPTTVTFYSNLPPAQNLFKLNQDLSDTKIRAYNITVRYRDQETDSTNEQQLTFTHIIEQDWEIIREIMANYKYNGTGATDASSN
jgi:hypothetical protein